MGKLLLVVKQHTNMTLWGVRGVGKSVRRHRTCVATTQPLLCLVLKDYTGKTRHKTLILGIEKAIQELCLQGVSEGVSRCFQVFPEFGQQKNIIENVGFFYTGRESGRCFRRNRMSLL